MRKNPFHPPVHSTAAPPSYYFTNNNGLLMQSADLLAKQKLSVQKIVMTKTVYLGSLLFYHDHLSLTPSSLKVHLSTPLMSALLWCLPLFSYNCQPCLSTCLSAQHLLPRLSVNCKGFAFSGGMELERLLLIALEIAHPKNDQWINYLIFHCLIVKCRFVA